MIKKPEEYAPTGKANDFIGSEGMGVTLRNPMTEAQVFETIGRGMMSTWGLDRLSSDQVCPNLYRHLTVLALDGKAFGGQHLEGVRITFEAINVSRSLAQQLTRCRLAGYGHEGTRDTNLKDFDTVIPASIASDPDLDAQAAVIIDNIRGFIEASNAKGIPFQDSSMFAPLGMTSDIVCHTNLSVLFSSFRIRLTNQTKWEIHDMFGFLRKEIEAVWPTIALWFVAPCEFGQKCMANPTLFPPCGKYRHPRGDSAMTKSHFGEPYKFRGEQNPNQNNIAEQKREAATNGDRRARLVNEAQEYMSSKGVTF